MPLNPINLTCALAGMGISQKYLVSWITCPTVVLGDTGSVSGVGAWSGWGDKQGPTLTSFFVVKDIC